LECLLAAHDRAGSFLNDPALAAIADDLTVWTGRRLGVYELTREIGRGGMGVIFLATRVDELFQQQVAVKVLRSNLDGRDALSRFDRERQILASLDHPNIARLLDGGTTEEQLPYVVMEYVEGQPIDAFCRDHRLSVTQRLELFQTLCGAVHYAHQNLVVHRDLKPSNIAVTREGQLKLLDFGIAKLLQSDLPDQTKTDVRLMTLEYASPEQITGGVITTTSDVYALGVVLYQLVSGERPHRRNGDSERDLIRQICDCVPAAPSKAVTHRADDLRPVHRLRRELAGDVDTIVLKALQKEPARRYSSAEQLSDDITRYLTGMPVLARKDTVRYRAAKFVRRHTFAVAATALLVVAVLGGAIAFAREARVAERQRQVAEAQRARAERRFNDVRRLGNSFLFEFHDAIAHLPGSTPARKLVVSKALEYLGSLESESGSDVSLQQELATAYDRVGDVLGNPALANLGDAAGALAAYRKALAIRVTVASTDPALARISAVSYEKVGGAEFAAGNLTAAFTDLRKAMDMREASLRAAPDSADAAHRVAEMAGRLCTGLVLLGDMPGALANCRLGGALTSRLLKAHPADTTLRTQMAVNTIALGNALRLSGQPAEAADILQTAVEQFQPLMAEDATNADLQRRDAIAYAYLANAKLDLHDSVAAMADYRVAIALLQGLVSADPSNVRFRTDLTYMLFRQGGLMTAAGEIAVARASTTRGLALLRLSAARPTASAEDLNDYAWWLAICQPPDLRQPARAIEISKRAVALAHGPNASYLHTLGWAYFTAGDRSHAVDALQRALAVLAPPAAGGASSGLRRQVEVDLLEFGRDPHVGSHTQSR
jgi:tetratricopeptide (TPR) repeat protein/tRNA A-37 threonylcarbamoyl transferase component Bud32